MLSLEVNNMTYGEWYQQYLALYKRKLAPKTRESYDQVTRLYILPAAGGVDLARGRHADALDGSAFPVQKSPRLADHGGQYGRGVVVIAHAGFMAGVDAAFAVHQTHFDGSAADINAQNHALKSFDIVVVADYIFFEFSHVI